MRVLITGAGGFIGSHLVEDQLSRGNQVTAVDLNTTQLASLAFDDRLKIIQNDFIDPEFVNKELEGHEICYHLASAHLETGVGDEYFWKVNVNETLDFVNIKEGGMYKLTHMYLLALCFGDTLFHQECFIDFRNSHQMVILIPDNNRVFIFT
jgi:UDP-glucose 4-epimerase